MPRTRRTPPKTHIYRSPPLLDLQMDPSAAKGYKSASQIARRVTEDWATRNLYCASCAFNELSPAKTNAPVLDFRCPECASTYQLKGQRRRFGRKASNSAYGKKMDAINNGSAPHYVFLQYSADDWRVKSLFIVPGHFFTPVVIQERPPLPPTARRPGWIGSNILLSSLPDEARVAVVADGVPRNSADVRHDWARFRFLRDDPQAQGGWGAAVLICVRHVVHSTGSRTFTLRDFYAAYATGLAAQFSRQPARARQDSPAASSPP